MFEDKDFDRLTYNVHKYRNLGGVELLSKFSLVNGYLGSFIKLCPSDLDFGKVFRFVVYLYDRNSPLLGIDDWYQRRKEVGVYIRVKGGIK